MRAFVALCLAIASLLVALLAATSVTATAGASARERSVVRAINFHRRITGVPRVRGAAGLARAAGYHSREMLAADFFSHNSRDGSSFATRIRRFARFNAVGEVIAMLSGCRGAARRAVTMWLNSPPHRSILLSGTYRRIGVGVVRGRYAGRRTCMVTADFGRR
jgi:uncharacterized protein YkwD